MKANARKLAALSLAAALSLGLAACGGGGDTPATARPALTPPVPPARRPVTPTRSWWASPPEPKYIEPNAPGMGPRRGAGVPADL